MTVRTEHDIVATYRRELKAAKKSVATLMAENARLRSAGPDLLGWPPELVDTIRDVLHITQALHVAADPLASQRYGDHARLADPPLPHEPREREMFAVSVYAWHLRRCNETAAAYSPIGRQITPAGPRPKPPPRKE